MKTTWLVSLLITAVALSGCADDGGDETAGEFREEFETQSNESQEDPGAEGTGETNATKESAPGSIEVTLTADNLIGTAPLTVQFTIDATATDAEGGPAETDFEWALFSQNETDGFEESGSGLPATANFTFETAGNYTLIAGVSADGFEDGFANVTISITDLTIEAPDPETWWLYLPDNCGGDGVLKQTEGGPDGACLKTDGAASGVLATPEDQIWMTLFHSEGKSAGFPAGTSFEGQATLTAIPAFTPLAVADIHLFANNKPVSIQELTGWGPQPGPTYTLTWNTTLDNPIPAGASLTLGVRVRDTATWGYSSPLGTDPDSFILG